MSSKTNYKCDVCGKPIEEGHQKYYMAIVSITYTYSIDGCGETETTADKYHVHNDLTNHCMRKIWDVFKNKKR